MIPGTHKISRRSAVITPRTALCAGRISRADFVLWSDTASQITMRSSAEWDLSAHAEKFSISRPSLTCLATIHETGATWLYQGQVVRLEWQSWHERSRIRPTCGSITCAMCAPESAEILGVVAVETNCIPRKIKPSKIEVSFSS